MSAGEDEFVPPPDDPFLAEDPAATERERRRLQREAKRNQRSNRASLGERVSGALDGAAAKGKEAIEQGRERVVAPKEPPPDAPEPPPLRRAPAPPEDFVPTPTAPVARARQSPAPPIVDHGETDDFAPPAPVAANVARPAEPVRADEGDDIRPPRDERSGPPSTASGSGPIWLRRAGVLVAAILLAAGAAFAISRAGGEDEPAPVAKGPAKLKTVDVTIPEGLSREEMAQVAKDAGLGGDYAKATKEPPKSFDAKKIGFPAGASLEGFLFPATYNLEKGAPAKDLVGQQLEAFDQNISEVDLKQAEKKNLTIYDVVTIASMIEREVQVAEERPLVAAVIYNRLADGEPLGIDATLRYEVGFDEPLTESQLAADTPYNTRTNAGLPPTPIGNPGLDSLKAAADPADVNFKYYVFKPGSCGEHSFTADYDEFINLSNEYQAALEAEGGQPTSC